MVYVYLIGAIVLEVCGTILLPYTENFSKPLPSVGLVVFYTLSFYLMTFTLGKLPLAVVYATWSGMGIFCISVLSYYFLNQSLGWQVIFGMALIVSGVTIVNLYAKMPH
mgnify:CR=1 FL=1